LRRIPVALTSGWGGAGEIPEAEPPTCGAEPDFDAVAAEPAFCTFEGADEPAPEVCEESVLEDSLPGDEARVLDRIAGLQRADGSWVLDADFVAAVGIEFLKLKAAVANEDNLEAASRALATAVALVFLETYAAKEQAEWRMLGKKATKWLAKQSGPKAGGTWLGIAKGFF
jgi:hypothetical protein